MSQKPDTPISYVSAGVVLIILSILGIATLVDLFDGPGTEREERVAKTPQLPINQSAIRAFPGDVRHYLKERYALKDWFISANAEIKLNIFGHSPAPNVLIGQENFLFLNNRAAIALVQGAGFPQPASAQAWEQHFRRLRTAFDHRSIPFVLVVAPNKHSVYPEFLPKWLQQTRREGNLVDRVLMLARANLDPATLDLRRFLQAHRVAKPNDQLYFLTDTHWNELGAALAVKAVLDSEGITVQLPKVFAEASGRGGDLARNIGRQSKLSEVIPRILVDARRRCSNVRGEKISLSPLDPLPIQEFTCQMPDAWPGKALVFIDSFGASAVPMLSQVFQRSHFIWQDAVDMELIDQEAPDIVIQVLVERKIQEVDPESLLKD